MGESGCSVSWRRLGQQLLMVWRLVIKTYPSMQGRSGVRNGGWCGASTVRASWLPLSACCAPQTVPSFLCGLCPALFILFSVFSVA